MKKLNQDVYLRLNGGRQCTWSDYTKVAGKIGWGAFKGARAMAPTGMGALAGGIIGGAIGLTAGAITTNCKFN